jgi:hypothetical protein
MKFLLSILPAVGALLFSSCGVSANYAAASTPTAPYKVAVVKPFVYKADEPVSSGAARTAEFTPVLLEELQNVNRFSKVTTGSYSGRAIRVEGEVTYLDEGNTAMRIGVGFGTGKAHYYCTARFVDNQTGKLIGTYDVFRSTKQGMMGLAEDFTLVRRYAACDVAAKAAEVSNP